MLVAHYCYKPYRSLVKSYGESLHHRGYQLVCIIELIAVSLVQAKIKLSEAAVSHSETGLF